MTIIAVYSGRHRNADQVVQKLHIETGYRLITDDIIVEKAALASKRPAEKIRRCFSSRASIFNDFIHENKLSLASLRLALANEIGKEPTVVFGYTSLLIPSTVKKLVRIRLIADMAHRTRVAEKNGKAGPDNTPMNLEKEHAKNAAWGPYLFQADDPSSESLFDLVLSTDGMSDDDTVETIKRSIAAKPELRVGWKEDYGIKDFLLAATVELALCKAGHDVSIQVLNGHVLLSINKQVLMRSRLESELLSIVKPLPSVRSVNIRVVGDKSSDRIYRKHSVDLPSRVLLVDDEQEFVQTLSERLQLRGIGSAVALDGQSALRLVNEDPPEVMILDLKMPGMDGMELLKRVKSARPEIEIFILTGHGSQRDRDESLALGAFAYMQKPVDIDQLVSLLKDAHQKIQQTKSQRR